MTEFLDLAFHLKKEIRHKAGEAESKVTREFFQKIMREHFFLWSSGRHCHAEAVTHENLAVLNVQFTLLPTPRMTADQVS